jgi:phosphonate transport system substrate-binding protein
MTTPQPTSPSAPKAGGSHWPAIGLVALLVAAAGGYYAYERSQNPTPPPVDEFDNMREYFRRVGQGLKMAPEYQDTNSDLVADPPSDPTKFAKVEEITFTVVPSEDPERQKKEQEDWQDLVVALEKVTGKKVRYATDITSTDAQLAAIKGGTLQVTAFNTGLVPTAVNTAGFVPLFAPADAAGSFSYEMEILVRADSPVQKPEDLKGKTLGFVALSSNSGAKAPMVVLKERFGLLPGRDYKFLITGSHEESVKELLEGKFDAVCVANDLLARMYADGKVKGVEVKPQRVRSILKSDSFPPLCFGVPHNLPPELREKVRQAFAEFRFEGTSVGRRFVSQGKVKFAPVDYKLNWAFVRQIDESLSRLADAPK